MRLAESPTPSSPTGGASVRRRCTPKTARPSREGSTSRRQGSVEVRGQSLIDLVQILPRTAPTAPARTQAILLRSRPSAPDGRFRGPSHPRVLLGLAGKINRRSYLPRAGPRPPAKARPRGPIQSTTVSAIFQALLSARSSQRDLPSEIFPLLSARSSRDRPPRPASEGRFRTLLSARSS